MENIDFKKMKVAMYIRVANKEQVKEDSSIERQKTLINNYLKERGGVKSKQLYIDNGFSGTTYNRPEFKRLMRDIKGNKFDILVVNDLSRFGRTLDVFERIYEMKKTYNTDFISVTDNVDTLENKMFFDIRNCICDMYKKDMRERNKKTREYRNKKC